MDKIKRVVLETSLKPFKNMDKEAIKKVCREMFEQWKPLLTTAEESSILLWSADGSEILTWTGELDKRIEWARYIGFANGECFGRHDKSDPMLARLYTESPAEIYYRDLLNIISTLKEIALCEYGINLTVGATFDPGPEFAYSDFKYKLHPEINTAILNGEAITMKTDYMVLCPWAKLHGDSEMYAGYPEGIPEGTSLGTFLGRQCKHFLPAMGFDYIWFSNGFGFSFFPWTYLGANFNGSRFGNANYSELTEKLISFWEDFKRECPDYRVEVRGTNYGTGMDLAKDFIPLKTYFDKGFLKYPPPNSPWGALNYDFGLEITGFMSRIAYTPGREFPFRFYSNDPWFWQNPWKDCYERNPHDIYCPLSVARLNNDGLMESPNIIEFLTIDTEYGVLDEECPSEIIPHIKRAVKDFPDRPGILTWVYPFDEYHLAMEENQEIAPFIFFNDWFMRNAVNNGFPVNSVVNTKVLMDLIKNNKLDVLKDSILVIPTKPLDSEFIEIICKYICNGGKVLFYGPMQDNPLISLLNIRLMEAIEGEFDIRAEGTQDFVSKGLLSGRVQHESMISAGGITECLNEFNDQNLRVCVTAIQEKKERVYALTRKNKEWNGGMAGWIRGSLPFVTGQVTHLPVQQSMEYIDTSIFMRYILSDFGYTLLQERHEVSTRPVMNFISRHDNSYLFSGYKYDTTVMLRYGFPQGAPLLVGQDAYIENGCAVYSLSRAFHCECRVFVKQKDPGIVSLREGHPLPTRRKQPVRNLKVIGLHDAEISIYPPYKVLESGLVEVKADGRTMDITDKLVDEHFELKNVSGVIEITW